MNVVTFVKSIYLGDRACKKIIIDGWNDKIFVQVDSISRVRSVDGKWNFYSEEDINNGFLVFDKIKSIVWSENGKIPNDIINYLEVSEKSSGMFVFTLSVDSVNADGSSEEVILKIDAEGISLMDPLNPDFFVTE